jgi:hypothetical protein
MNGEGVPSSGFKVQGSTTVNRELRTANHLPYFRTPERLSALRSQLSLWAGTRWAHAGTRPNQMRCGVTGDCLFWVHAFKAIGALPAKIEIPDYRKMEAAGDQMRMLRECIEATRRATLIWHTLDTPESALLRMNDGDVLLFSNGMSGAHCGLIVRCHPFHFAHLSKNGFNEEPIRQTHWLDSLAFVYRLMEAHEP